MWSQLIGNHGLGIFRCGQILPWAPPSRSNDDSLALVSCLSSDYKFVLVLWWARSSFFLLRKIALPYPHKCLFVLWSKRIDRQEFFKEIFLSQEVTPLSAHVRACAVLVVDRRSSRALHNIFGWRGSNTYFFLLSSIYRWKSMKFWSVHLAVVIHYSTGTTTNSASLVLKGSE